MRQYDALIFDFDGVLIESVDVKTKAFADLYSGYGPEIVDKVVAFHLSHGGVSRFQKFRYFHREYLGAELTTEEEAEFGRRFSELVESAVVEVPWVEGAAELVQSLYRTISMFVASGTPEDELLRIVERRGMQRYFVSVHGSPATKAEIIDHIVGSHRFQRRRVLMVGDSLTDYEGAIEAGVPFIGRVPSAIESLFPSHVPTVRDLRGLLRLI